MFKKYLKDDYGESAEFWDNNWDHDWENKYRHFPSIDLRLIRHITKYLNKGIKLLEGGCGDCQYMKYFVINGFHVIGIDFAEKTIQKVKEYMPDLDVRKADIRALPFHDNEFDAYYSGGVIEHFEVGPDVPLSEAYRVIKSGGYFFVTVPHLNLMRWISSLIKKDCLKTDLDGRKAYIRKNIFTFKIDKPQAGYHFHEYFFNTYEMRYFLKKHNFKILKEVCFSSIYGLLDLTAFRTLHGTNRKKRNYLNKSFSLLVRIIKFIEKSNLFLFQVLSYIIGMIFGNLKLYVCMPIK